MCSPQSFESIKDPSTQKIWIGPEYNPNAYEKRYDENGVYYVAKPEFTAEQQAKVAEEATDEKELRLKAEARKRAERRTETMSETEMRQALHKAKLYADWIEESSERSQQEADLAEAMSWRGMGNA
jgi:replicative superfamily II helicase